MAFFFYFKEIKIIGLENGFPREPLLYLPNHQNALLDALLIAVSVERKPYFLTRSDVFANPVLRGIFHLLRMLPIYRLRDGRGALRKNQDLFDTCSELLSQGKSIVIFPEGNHNLRRQVRTLSKGFTRILWHTLEEYPRLVIRLVPIGINYACATAFPDRVALFYGSPIEVIPVKTPRASSDFIVANMDKVTAALRQLTTHIDASYSYEEVLKLLDAAGVDYLSPEEVNTLLNSPSNLNIRPKNKVGIKWYHQAFRTGFLLFNLFPVLIWRFLIKKSVPEPEFLSSYRFLFALFIMPCYYLMVFVLVTLSIGSIAALTTTMGLILMNLLYVKNC